MARAVQPWTWRRALRHYCPKHLLLTLYTINTYMGRDGYAYPGQSLIAECAGKSTRTVQRQIAEALALGWLAVQTAGRGGQGWRHNAYRAAVPDDLELDDLDEEIADALVRVEDEIDSGERNAKAPSKGLAGPFGKPSRKPSDAAEIARCTEGDDIQVSLRSVEADDSLMSSRPSVESKADDIIVSPPSPIAAPRTCPGASPAVTFERDDSSNWKVTTPAAEGDDTECQKVTTPGCRTISGSESPASRYQAPEEGPTHAGPVCPEPMGSKTTPKTIERRQLTREEHLALIEAAAGKSIDELVGRPSARSQTQ